MYELGDTIVSIATPPGEGGIGIVRLSGSQALTLAGLLTHSGSPLKRSRALLFRRWTDPATKIPLDEGLMLVMPGPGSYTGEDVVELHAHGSPAVLKSLVECLSRRGARPALPGEFTYRAFRNGRLDLSQAEAVQALVASHGEASRRQAMSQLTGGLSSHLEPLEERLKSLYLQLEARLEFPEEGLPDLDLSSFTREISEARLETTKLRNSYDQGRVLRQGLIVALVGAPNVGKSSLLNALLGVDRAIVTEVAGTTRDAVEGEIFLKGVRARLFDTAGFRASGDRLEREGIRRSLAVMEEADSCLWVLDASRPQEGLSDAQARAEDPRYLFVVNKNDLAPEAPFPFPADRMIRTSCRTKEGLEALRAYLEEAASPGVIASDVVLTQERHKNEIQAAEEALGRLEKMVQAGETREKWAEELKTAALAVGRVRGRNLPEDAFEEIFRTFCVGK